MLPLKIGGHCIIQVPPFSVKFNYFFLYKTGEGRRQKKKKEDPEELGAESLLRCLEQGAEIAATSLSLIYRQRETEWKRETTCDRESAKR